MPTRSVAIAGAGPAGLAAALCLHRDGHRVTVFERFSAPQPIGAGLMLQPTGLAVLRELGLAEKVLARGRRIDRMFGRVLPSRRTVLDLHYRTLAPDAFGLAVHRATLFTPLFDAVRKNSITIETGRTVTGAEQASGGQRRLVFADGRHSAPFDLVVDGLGMRSPLAPIYHGGARHDLTYGALWTTLPWPQGHFDEHITSPDQFTLARYAHYTVMRPIAAAFAAIGDSAHATSPQLGQGANMALLDAYALALALRGSADLAEALSTYTALRRWHIRFYQSLSAMFTPFYQSDSGVLPPLRDWIVAPATRLPLIRGFVAATVAGTILDPRRTLGLGRESGARPVS
jgi:2-polyprenyl-6-methoxyphenol hydroxylase-like FAD-dependent oxidoreductase